MGAPEILPFIGLSLFRGNYYTKEGNTYKDNTDADTLKQFLFLLKLVCSKVIFHTTNQEVINDPFCEYIKPEQVLDALESFNDVDDQTKTDLRNSFQVLVRQKEDYQDSEDKTSEPIFKILEAQFIHYIALEFYEDIENNTLGSSTVSFDIYLDETTINEWMKNIHINCMIGDKKCNLNIEYDQISLEYPSKKMMQRDGYLDTYEL